MSTSSNQFQLLRARVENSLKAPYALLISSALATDGKSVCAQGLAASMAGAGHKTLLIDIDSASPRLTGLPKVTSLALTELFEIDRALVKVAGGLTVLSLASDTLDATASKESVAAFIAHLRSRFHAIIVEGAALVDSSMAILFANACDGVILTTREGRSVRDRDRATIETLEREQAAFLGVVTVGARSISEFESKPQPQQVRVAKPALSKSLVH